MNRLGDGTMQGPVYDKGQELIRNTPATQPDPELKRRVWVSLQHAEAAGGGWRARHGSRRWSFALVAAILGLCGTAAAMIVQRLNRLPAPPAPMAPSLRPAPRARVAIAPPAALPSPVAIATAERVSPPARQARPVRPAPVRAREPKGTSLGVASERTQVLDAMVALRRDHDAERAGRLLDRYLTAHPQGVLREEALVLAIEAATARGDDADARRLAASYTYAYPAGRFQKYARETLRADAP